MTEEAHNDRTAEEDHNDFMRRLLGEGKEAERENWLRFLGAEVPADEAGEPEDVSPDFDGGAREPAPAPTNPEQDHTDLLVDLLTQLPPSTGGAEEW